METTKNYSVFSNKQDLSSSNAAGSSACECWKGNVGGHWGIDRGWGAPCVAGCKKGSGGAIIRRIPSVSGVFKVASSSSFIEEGMPYGLNEGYSNVGGEDCGEGSYYDTITKTCKQGTAPGTGGGGTGSGALDFIKNMLSWAKDTTGLAKDAYGNIKTFGNANTTTGGAGTTVIVQPAEDKGISPLAIAGIAFAGILIIGGILYVTTKNKAKA